jgi:hypothetical protein
MFIIQKDGMSIGSSLSPIISNIYMECLEKVALDSAQHKPLLCLRSVHTFVVWPHGSEHLQNFPQPPKQFQAFHQLHYGNRVSAIPFLDVMVIDSVINSKGISHMNKEEKPLGFVCISHVMGTSVKFEPIGNQYSIRTIFKTKHALKSSVIKIKRERYPQQMAQCVYSIPSERDGIYTGKTGRPLWLHENRHNLEGFL